MKSLHDIEDAALQALVHLGLENSAMTAELLPGGLMNYTVRLHGPCGDYCVRLRPEALPPSSQQFGAERWAARLARAASIACAPLVGVLLNKEIEGWQAAVFETVHGQRFDHFQAQAAPADTAAISRSWGAGLARLHNLPCEGFGTLLETVTDEPVNFLHDLLGAEANSLAGYDSELASLYADQINLVCKCSALSVRQPCYVHGDMHARNILVRDGQDIWLDWEACRRRLPEFDFAQLPFLAWRQAPESQSAMIDGYRTVAVSSQLSPNLLNIIQIYWHIRFGLFLQSCTFPVDTAYFGTFNDHISMARHRLDAGPSQWMNTLCH